ncbi:fimbria/pilus periplasmic chaperone [Cedecea sp.]|uniref:fimbria/pilus periplasmic chaperone n=1 Tax=Cedecea sp. TaxID=1970739 RepID=UPI002F426D4A
MVVPSLCLVSALAHAEGGISVLGTRIVLNEGDGQASVRMVNTSKKDSFLIQSWVENSSGQKEKDFVVTPPLYMSGPRDSNALRLVYTGPALPKDRESLFYFIEKSIPSVDKKKLEGENVLLIATANRLKLFARPEGLSPAISEAPSLLTFSHRGSQLDIGNPSPYYQTLIDIKVSGREIKPIMVPPKDHVVVSMPVSAMKVSYRTINDYGASTPEQVKDIN